MLGFHQLQEHQAPLAEIPRLSGGRAPHGEGSYVAPPGAGWWMQQETPSLQSVAVSSWIPALMQAFFSAKVAGQCECSSRTHMWTACRSWKAWVLAGGRWGRCLRTAMLFSWNPCASFHQQGTLVVRDVLGARDIGLCPPRPIGTAWQRGTLRGAALPATSNAGHPNMVHSMPASPRVIAPAAARIQHAHAMAGAADHRRVCCNRTPGSLRESQECFGQRFTSNEVRASVLHRAGLHQL
jgi:hypothetical protein